METALRGSPYSRRQDPDFRVPFTEAERMVFEVLLLLEPRA